MVGWLVVDYPRTGCTHLSPSSAELTKATLSDAFTVQMSDGKATSLSSGPMSMSLSSSATTMKSLSAGSGNSTGQESTLKVNSANVVDGGDYHKHAAGELPTSHLFAACALVTLAAWL